MGLREKEESVTSPRFFYMSNWIDGDAMSGMGKTEDAGVYRVIKNSV